MNAFTRTFAVSAALLYGAFAVTGNTWANDVSPSALDKDERRIFEKMLPEDLVDFELHAEPRPFRDKSFIGPDGKPMDLSAFEGKVTVLNFWAIWCPPCRKELPNLNNLQTLLGDEGVEVVTISLDKAGIKKAKPYLENHNLDDLKAYTDPKASLSREMGVLGLPVTAILGPDAREIGRYLGEATWDSEAAQEWLRFIVKATQPDARAI